ncbi:hypothetical protein, partial [Vibrio parahaemolyticus]|uniref:hypothetical protein n=1 Tax=Vibrio parahaemolyticus TaxID=670 RepID=UPI001E5489A6
KHFFKLFICELILNSLTLLTRLRLTCFPLATEAHYREFIEEHKPIFQKNSPFQFIRIENIQSGLKAHKKRGPKAP